MSSAKPAIANFYNAGFMTLQISKHFLENGDEKRKSKKKYLLEKIVVIS